MEKDEKMYQEILNQMIRVALDDLSTLNDYTPKDAIKDIAKKAFKRPTSNRDPLFWPAGLLMMGLCEAESLDEEIRPALCAYFDEWLKSGEKVSYVDDSISGLALINLYMLTGEKRYHHGAVQIANFLARCPKNSEESIIYNPAAGNDYIFADGAGQSAMFLARYGAVFHKKQAFLLAASQLLNYYNCGMDARTKLPYHAYSMESTKKMGILGWGRAMGWLLLGYSEILSNLSDAGSADKDDAGESLLKATENKLMSQFYSLVRVTLDNQRLDGGFSWLIPAIEGEPDTSATAMIAYAIAKWLKSGSFKNHSENLAEEAEKAVHRAQEFILKNTENGSVGQSLSSCEDLAVHRQQYGHYPWGQGSALALMAVMR